MKSLLIFFLLNFSNTTGCNVYKPKFQIGDCIVTVFKGEEVWDHDRTIHHKIKIVGRDHYWLEGEDDFSFHFDIPYIDGDFEKRDLQVTRDELIEEIAEQIYVYQGGMTPDDWEITTGKKWIPFKVRYKWQTEELEEHERDDYRWQVQHVVEKLHHLGLIEFDVRGKK